MNRRHGQIQFSTPVATRHHDIFVQSLPPCAFSPRLPLVRDCSSGRLSCSSSVPVVTWWRHCRASPGCGAPLEGEGGAHGVGSDYGKHTASRSGRHPGGSRNLPVYLASRVLWRLTLTPPWRNRSSDLRWLETLQASPGATVPIFLSL